MAKNNHPDDTVKVKDIPPRKGVKTGKPGKFATTTSMRMNKTAFPMSGGTIGGSGGNFYSPELSTDFLELPQSIDERRNFYRFFYDHEPYVGQAIDTHVDLPLSKVRLAIPKAQNRELAERSMRFCERWVNSIHLLQRLMEISHEYHLLGEAIIFAEDTSPEMPREIREQRIREITVEGEATDRWETYEDADKREVAWLKKNYTGWTAIRCLPPEQIHVESFPFTDEKLIELIPDSKTKAIINRADTGDIQAMRIVNSMPQEIVQAVKEGQNIPLNTDPDAGSFVHILARKRSQYEPRGQSFLQRCLLPGTPIWINRDGIVQQIPVEDVKDGELLLTHKGRFRPCKTGSRQVNEQVVHLSVEDLEEKFRITADHEVLRLQDNGAEEWVEAGKLQPGDVVREGHVVPEKDNWNREINLAEWWKGRTVQTLKRGRPDMGLTESIRKIEAVDATVTANPGLSVRFSYENDNRNRARSLPGMTRLLEWAQNLENPIQRTQAEVAESAGISERDVRVYAPRLCKEGLVHTEAKYLGRGRGKAITWFPASKNFPLKETTIISPVTTIEVTENFCYLLGTWLGDGCIWTETDSLLNTHSLGWALHDAELEIQKRIRDLISKCWPNATILEGALIGEGREEEGARPIRIEDPLLARWFQ
ncbi:MAG: Hint domain-containing protein, partial [Bacteroidota bacterium]